jgi:hypothetical protein
MARKIATGDAKPEQCVNLVRPEYQENLEKIKSYLQQGVEIGAKGTIVVEETGVTYIHPCISEAGRIAAESKLTAGPEGPVNLKFGFFDPIAMCWALNVSGLFREVRCSPRLGVARVIIDDKTVMVFQDGRINVRRAKDKQDAIQTIRLVSRSLWGAIICSCCGNSGLDCGSGGCEECLGKVCPVIGGGPPDPTISGRDKTQATTASTMFDRVKALETRHYFEEAIQILDKGFETFQALGAKLSLGVFDKSGIQELEGWVASVNQLAIRFIVDTPKIQDAAIGVILGGIALDLSRMIDGLKTLAQYMDKLNSFGARELFASAVDIAVAGYRALKTMDFNLSEQVKGQYMAFRKKWAEGFRTTPDKDVFVAIEKIATNGYYIARLLAKPVPA